MRKAVEGFLWVWGSAWRPFGKPKLGYKNWEKHHKSPCISCTFFPKIQLKNQGCDSSAATFKVGVLNEWCSDSSLNFKARLLRTRAYHFHHLRISPSWSIFKRQSWKKITSRERHKFFYSELKKKGMASEILLSKDLIIDMKACDNHHVSVLKLYLFVLICLLVALHWNLKVCSLYFFFLIRASKLGLWLIYGCSICMGCYGKGNAELFIFQ